MEMTSTNITQKIRDIFHERISDDSRHGKYFWKWVGNWELAKLTGWNIDELRKICKSMQSEGRLQGKKSSNTLLWAIEIDGYLQHEFKDYYYAVEGTCSQTTCDPLVTGCNVEGEFHVCKCKYFTQTNKGDYKYETRRSNAGQY